MPDLMLLLANTRWVLAAIVAFGAMIFVHELGHFLVAKRTGVVVHAFALGFGPKLLAFRRGGTAYAINLLPFGGYVRMAGEDFDATADEEGSFRHRSVWQRMAIVTAGPAMNLLLAVALLSLVGMTYGVQIGVTNRVATLQRRCPAEQGGALQPGCPAEQVGLRPGDAIVAIDGRPMERGEEVVRTIHQSPGKRLVLTVERDGQRFTVEVTPRLEPTQQIGLIGFAPEPLRQRLNPAASVTWGVRRTAEMAVTLVGAIVNLIRVNRFLENLGGPVAAANALVEAARSGVENFLYMTSFLSVVIGLFNLFPIPALDGGRLAFLAVEAVRGRPVDPRREGYIHLVGFALLLLLLVVLTGRDIRRL